MIDQHLCAKENCTTLISLSENKYRQIGNLLWFLQLGIRVNLELYPVHFLCENIYVTLVLAEKVPIRGSSQHNICSPRLAFK